MYNFRKNLINPALHLSGIIAGLTISLNYNTLITARTENGTQAILGLGQFAVFFSLTLFIKKKTADWSDSNYLKNCFAIFLITISAGLMIFPFLYGILKTFEYFGLM